MTGLPIDLDLPKQPDSSAADDYKIRLQGLVGEWNARQRDSATSQDKKLALEATRGDTELALENARADKKLALDATRGDTELALENARADADRATDVALFKVIHDGYVAIAQSSLDRSLQRATFVITASASIVTLYSGLLAFRFKVDGNVLPARGIIPSLFLGASVALSTFYVAFLRRKTLVSLLLPSGTGATVAETRLRSFLDWVFAGVVARSWSLRMAVISLALGLAFLPLPFLNISSGIVAALTCTAAGILVAWAIGEALSARAAPNYAGGPPAIVPPAPN